MPNLFLSYVARTQLVHISAHGALYFMLAYEIDANCNEHNLQGLSLL
jgi:hypothetical protein